MPIETDLRRLSFDLTELRKRYTADSEVIALIDAFENTRATGSAMDGEGLREALEAARRTIEGAISDGLFGDMPLAANVTLNKVETALAAQPVGGSAAGLREAAKMALQSMREAGFVHPGDVHENDPAIAALEAALASPASAAEGWVLVPREPTDEMIDAYFDRCRELGFTAHINATAAWQAMIDAVPPALSTDGADR